MAYIEWLFSLNQTLECKFPCWWGLEPNTTDFITVANLMKPFNPKQLYSEDKLRVLYFHFDYEAENTRLIAEAFFNGISYQGMTTVLSFNRNATSPLLTMAKDSYSPSAVLERVGRPSKVFLHMNFYVADPPARTEFSYQILLIYPDRGFAIEYFGDYPLPENPENSLKLCANFETLSSIRYYIQAPMDFENFLTRNRNAYGLIEQRISSGYYLTWEEATGLNDEEFARIFSTPNPECFESSAHFSNH